MDDFILIMALFLGLFIAIVFLLKYSIDSYREERDKKQMLIGIISASLVILIPFLTFEWVLGISVLTGFLLILFLGLLLITMVILDIYYFAKVLLEYKEDRNSSKLKKNLIVIAVVTVMIIASFYVSIEYITTPDANQEFVLELEQNETSEVELVLPNLEGDGRYFPVEEYEVVEGEGEINSQKDGEYIKITTSSESFKMKYFEEAEMFSEYNDEWDFQYPELEEENEGGDEKAPMNISYSSEQNTTCHLTLRWEDESVIKATGGHGHWYEVEAETYIDGKTESIEVHVEREAV